MSALKDFNPSLLSEEQLKVMGFALAGVLKKHFEVEKPLRVKEAAEFLDISQKHFYHLVNLGKIKLHRFEEDGRAYVFASEIVANLKAR